MSTGLRIADRDLAVVLALIPARGMGATRRVVSEGWFAKHPLRGMKIGADGFEVGAVFRHSSDDGRTWTDRVDIETEGWLCYPAFKEIDGRLFILYCFGDGMKSMRLTALPMDPGSYEKRDK